jgi:NAD(P)H-dependent FMN reductase
MKLAVITGSTREGRATQRQSKWIVATANNLEGVQADHLDLKDYALPFFDEPISPRYNPSREIDPAAKKWLDKLESYDAYVFVTPEYNHSVSGVLKNALDFVTWEIKRKPAAVASHGTVGGARAAVHLKEILSESQAVVIPNASAVAHMSNLIDEEGNLDAEAAANPYGPQGQLDGLLAELKWYSDALSAATIAELNWDKNKEAVKA